MEWAAEDTLSMSRIVISHSRRTPPGSRCEREICRSPGSRVNTSGPVFPCPRGLSDPHHSTLSRQTGQRLAADSCGGSRRLTPDLRSSRSAPRSLFTRSRGTDDAVIITLWPHAPQAAAEQLGVASSRSKVSTELHCLRAGSPWPPLRAQSQANHSASYDRGLSTPAS